MKKVEIKVVGILMVCVICATTASGQIEKDGKKYYVIGQRVGVLDGKEVPVSLYGGAPFMPNQIKTNGELKSPLKILVASFEKGYFVPTKESPTPLYMAFNEFAGKLESRMFTHAVNVTWEFIKPGIEFTAEGTLYETEKEGATISFTKDGVKMRGITKKSESRIWRYDSVGESEKDGNRLMVLSVFDPMSKYSIDIIKYRYRVFIPNSNSCLALPPDEKLMKTIRDLKKGDLIDIYTSTDGILTRIDRSSLLPSEDMPDSKVFVQLTTTKFKDTEFPAVTIRKFRRNETFPIARKNETGKWIADESLVKKLKDFKEGDLVEVDLQAEEPNVLRMGMQYFVTGIVPYKLPQIGKVLALEGGADGSPAIVKLKIEGKNKPATYYYEGLAKLEAGQQIWFRVMNVDGKEYLKFLWWKKD